MYPYRYNFRLRTLWGGKDSPLFGKRCRVIARDVRNKRMVEFEDGTVHIILGHALRKVSGTDPRFDEGREGVRS